MKNFALCLATLTVAAAIAVPRPAAANPALAAPALCATGVGCVFIGTVLIGGVAYYVWQTRNGQIYQVQSIYNDPPYLPNPDEPYEVQDEPVLADSRTQAERICQTIATNRGLRLIQVIGRPGRKRWTCRFSNW